MWLGSQGTSVVTKWAHDVRVSLDALSLRATPTHPQERGHLPGEDGVTLAII